MMRAAVLGSPISHSLSPALHQLAYRELGVEAQYSAIEVSHEDASGFFAERFREDWRGFSLTMPLKESIFDLGFDVDPRAQEIRSANTLVRRGSNFFATSTDLTAFERLLGDVTSDRVAIIGGGGTARAALGALDQSDKEISFLLRSAHRSEELQRASQKANLHFLPMDSSLEEFDLVISTVPVQGAMHVSTLVERMKPSSTFFEVLYHPSPTPALARAREKALRTFDGMDLLVEQALDQIAIFTEQTFDYASMRSLLMKEGRSHL